MIRYTVGSSKGESKIGEVLNEPFKLGKVDKNYTSERVVETAAAGSSHVVAWTPVVKGSFKDASGVAKDVKIIHKDGSADTFADVGTDGKTITATFAEGDRVAYVYDNVVIPQNDIPTVNAEMKSIGLVAKARRVAVYYSQIAAFQAKTDYGFDLGDQLAEKACGQLAYEIDTEVIDLLNEIAGAARADMEFDTTAPIGVSMADHLESFNRKIEFGKKAIYDITKRFQPNFMVCGSLVATILPFLKGFKASSGKAINGPYMAGTLNGGLKVFVTPNIAQNRYLLGVNGDDMMSAAAVYAPYMPIVPTQLLGYADGGMSQGFSTMYALEKLNDNLVVAGEIKESAYFTVHTKAESGF